MNEGHASNSNGEMSIVNLLRQIRLGETTRGGVHSCVYACVCVCTLCVCLCVHACACACVCGYKGD